MLDVSECQSYSNVQVVIGAGCILCSLVRLEPCLLLFSLLLHMLLLLCGEIKLPIVIYFFSSKKKGIEKINVNGKATLGGYHPGNKQSDKNERTNQRLTVR